jgi:hypothetical protein
LRTLLILAPLLAIGLGFGFRAWYAGYLERLAIEEIESLGGLITRNEAGEVVSVELGGAEINDEKLRRLAPHLMSLRRLETLVLISTSVSDEGLMLLADVPHLQSLHLSGTPVTDRGIARLQTARPKMLIDRTNPHIKAYRLARRPIYEHAILSLALAPEGGQILAGSGDGRLQVFDLADGEATASLQAHEEWTFAVAFHPGGRQVATGGGDGLVKLWSWPELEEIGRFTGHEDDVHAIAFTPDGQTLVSAGDDKTVRVWDVAAQRQRLVLKGHTGTIPGLAISPDGQIAASASRDDAIRLWDIVERRQGAADESANGEDSRCLAILEGHGGDVMSADFHPQGRELISASYDRTLIVWDLAAQRPSRTLEGHADWAFAVRYSADGEQAVSAAGDGVRLWELATGKLTWHSATPPNASHALWLSDTEFAASSANGSIGLFHVSHPEAALTVWTRFTPQMLERRKAIAE